MSWFREYTGTDNSDRKDFFSDDGDLQTTHVDRYDLGGNYKCTDVYSNHGEKIDTFVRD